METRPAQEKDWAKGYPKVSSILPFSCPVMLHLWQHAFFSIRGRVSGTEFKIDLKSFVWRPSEQIDFSANSSATPKRWQPSLSALWHGELFKIKNKKKLDKIEPVCCAQTVWSTSGKLRVVQLEKRRFSSVNVVSMPSEGSGHAQRIQWNFWQTLDLGRLWNSMMKMPSYHRTAVLPLPQIQTDCLQVFIFQIS